MDFLVKLISVLHELRLKVFVLLFVVNELLLGFFNLTGEVAVLRHALCKFAHGIFTLRTEACLAWGCFTLTEAQGFFKILDFLLLEVYLFLELKDGAL